MSLDEKFGFSEVLLVDFFNHNSENALDVVFTALKSMKEDNTQSIDDALASAMGWEGEKGKGWSMPNRDEAFFEANKEKEPQKIVVYDSDNRYKMLKNFIHNELGITRDEIRDWVQQAIQPVVQRECEKLDLRKNAEQQFKAHLDRLIADITNTSYLNNNVDFRKKLGEQLALEVLSHVVISNKSVEKSK